MDGLGARKLFKLSQDLHHTLSQGPIPPNPRWSACNLYGRPPELNFSACKYPCQSFLLRVDISSRRVIQVVLQHNFVLFICLFTGNIFHDITHIVNISN